MKQNFLHYLRWSIVLGLMFTAFMACDTSDDERLEKKMVLETPSIEQFKSSLNGFTRDFFAKTSDTTFNFLPDWTTVDTQETGGSLAPVLAVDALLNANVNGTSKVIALLVDGVMVNAIQVERPVTTNADGSIYDGETFYFDLDGGFLVGFVSENGVVTKRLQKNDQVSTAGFGSLLSLTLAFLQDEVDCDEDLWKDSIFCTQMLDVVVIGGSTGSSFPVYLFAGFYQASTPVDGSTGGGGGSTGCPPGHVSINSNCYKIPCNDSSNNKTNPLENMEILGTPGNGIPGGRHGWGRGRYHNGLDLKAPIGTPVFAMFSGFVDENRFENRFTGNYRNDLLLSRWDPFGNRVWINSNIGGDRYSLAYAHLSSVLVSRGQFVNKGQIIGFTGNTGTAGASTSGGPHLHLRTIKNGTALDPETLIQAQFNDNGQQTNKCN